ncbi:hypothetical protein EU537_07105 [Candidatus Thorarchaeota archaeon]|nr:MAG: hypothetical protein EU537_07105 [Candidatus Thorarchaeota archaeon]
MGLLDRWRRRGKKKEKEQKKRGREILTSGDKPDIQRSAPGVETLDDETKNELVSLVAEYERLKRKRQVLQEDRAKLTERLDRGELSTAEFRKELMSKIQEASRVSEKLKATSSRLTALGYRGILH